jgi:dihydrofolate synthase / folylpolyglutamate synthase
MTQPRTIDEWQAYIGRERPTDVARGLAPVAAVAARLGIMQPAARNLVIGGTNGKGSTAVFSEALLLSAGLRVGTTLSPHVVTFNERIRIDGVPAPDELICRALSAVDGARGTESLSYFEYVTLAALWAFKHAHVDVAVLEVGLGGRLDAVNVVDADVCVITSIGLDHEAILGAGRDRIGTEKAGILRPGVPFVCGDRDPPDSVLAAATRVGATLHRMGCDFDADETADHWSFRAADRALPGLPLPIVAVENAATALRAVTLLVPECDLTLRRVEAACARAVLAGRFQLVDARQRTFVLDVAHNPHGAAFLAHQLQRRPVRGRTLAIAGFLADKDAVGIVQALAGQIARWWFVSTGGDRARPAETIVSALQIAGIAGDFSAAPSLTAAIDAAAHATTADDRILLAGSFDIIQRASHLLAAVEAA